MYRTVVEDLVRFLICQIGDFAKRLITEFKTVTVNLEIFVLKILNFRVK